MRNGSVAIGTACWKQRSMLCCVKDGQNNNGAIAVRSRPRILHSVLQDEDGKLKKPAAATVPPKFSVFHAI
jgi:hypothetical protein